MGQGAAAALRYDIELVLKQVKHCLCMYLYIGFSLILFHLQGLSSMLLALIKSLKLGCCRGRV